MKLVKPVLEFNIESCTEEVMQTLQKIPHDVKKNFKRLHPVSRVNNVKGIEKVNRGEVSQICFDT